MHSQFNEDSIIEKYLLENRIFIPPMIVDVGAGDGDYISNSKLFIETYEYSGILVEVDPEQYEKLKNKYKDNSKIETVNRAVAKTIYPYTIVFNGDWSLNTIKRDTNSNTKTIKLSNIVEKAQEIGILSIDIEGLDTEVLNEMLLHSKVRPWIIIIEGNNPQDQEKQRELLKKEYTLYQTCNVNQIFINNNILSLKK